METIKNYDMQNPLKLTSNVVLTSRIWYINDIAMPWIALTQLFTIIQPKKINLVTTSLKRPVNDVTMTHVHACYLNWSYYPHVANPFERWLDVPKIWGRFYQPAFTQLLCFFLLLSFYFYLMIFLSWTFAPYAQR